MKTWKKWLLIVCTGAILVHAGTVLLYPRAITALVMLITEMRAEGVNRIYHDAVANAKVREVVRPSPDMLYSICVIDVSKGPVRVRTPASKPYTSITVFASNSDNIFAVNDQKAINGELEVLVTGPAEKSRKGSNIANLPSSKGIALIRRVFTDPDHMKEIDKSRQKAECRKL